MKTLIRGSEPFFWLGGDGDSGRVGCLLIHGFTGTPFEMRGLGKRLVAEGYTVLGPRLAHHGTQAADMNRSRWWDWYLAALDGWHMLNNICERVVVIGLSMGGLTALLMAANNPVTAVVAMSTPAAYMFNEGQLKMARYVWRVLPVLKKSAGEKDEPDWPSYGEFPVRATAELMDYKEALLAALPAVAAPALLLHAVDDPTVPFDNLDYIYDQIGSAEKQKVVVERGGHVMTEGSEKEGVYQEVIAFLSKVST